MEPNDDEAQHLAELRRIKRDRLWALDKQAGRYGDDAVPAHIEVERQRLRRELGLVESVIASPLGATIGDELSEGGRFVAYIELIRQLRQEFREGLARIEDSHVAFVAEYRDGRMRRDVFLIMIMVVVVILAMVLVFWIGRVSDGRGFVGSPLTMLFGGD